MSVSQVQQVQNQQTLVQRNSVAAAAEESEATATAVVQQARNGPIQNVKVQEEPEPIITAEDMDKLVVRGNNLFEELRLNEQFRLVRHDKLPRTMIRLIDISQDRIIREFPPKKYLDLVAALQELSGLFFDERV